MNKILFLSSIIFIVACQKDDSVKKSTSVEEGYIEINSENYNYSDTANAFINHHNKTIRVSSSLILNKLEITLDDITPGTYIFNSNSNTKVKLIQDSGKEYSSEKNPSTGWVTIENIDPVNWTITGSISGNIYEVNSGEKLSLNNGYFNKLNYYEPKGGGWLVNTINTFTCKVDGVTQTASSVNTSAGKGKINIFSSPFFSFPISWGPGTYTLNPVNSIFSYYEGYKSFEFENGTLIITYHDFDKNIITGEFTATVRNGLITREITEGQFTVVY